MLQCCGSPAAVPLGAGALFAVPAGLCGRGRLPVRLRSGSVPVQLRLRLDTKHAGTGLLMCVASILGDDDDDALSCTDDVILGRSSSRPPPSSPGSPAPPVVLQSSVSGGRTRSTGSSARCCRWAWPTCWTSALLPTVSPPAAGQATLHCRCTSCRWRFLLTINILTLPFRSIDIWI